MPKLTKTQMRRRSREIALQLIYEFDMRPDEDAEEIIGLFPFDEESPCDEVTNYAVELARGVYSESEKISEMLRDYIIGWRPERMVAVDKAAISMALYEGVMVKKVPIPVAISEAVELAKTYGTLDSGRFVNGVLGRIVRMENKE